MSEAATVDFGHTLDAAMAEDVPEDTQTPEVPEPETAATDDTPADPETPAPQPGEDRGDGRDVNGRWVGKGADPDAAGAPDPEVVPDAPTPIPFEYRAMGATRAWEGVTMDAEGNVTVPVAKLGELRAALNAKHLSEGEYVPLIERYKHENTELRTALQQKSLSETKAEQTLAAFAALMEEPEDTFWGKVAELRETFPQLQARAEVDYWKSLAAQQGRAPETATDPAESAPPSGLPSAAEAWAVTEDYIESTRLDPQYRDLSADDWKQFAESVKRTPMRYIVPATPDHAAKHPGVRVGEPVYDTDAFTAEVQDFAERKRATVRIASKAQQAAQFNAKVGAKPVPKPSPSLASAPATPAEEPEPGRKKLQSFFKPGGGFLADDD